MLTVTLDQARQFMLLKQGLLGKHRFAGKTVRISMSARPAAFSTIRWTSAAGMPN